MTGSTTNTGGGSTSSSGNPFSDALSSLGSGISNFFGGAGGGGDLGNALTGDTSGMSGFDVSGLFNNLGSDAFNMDTASAQATQAITPPAQAQTAAAQGTDPSAGLGGSQTGTPTTTGPNQPQQNQDQQQQQNQAQQRQKELQQIKKIMQQRTAGRSPYVTGAGAGANVRATPYPEGPSNQPEYGGYNSEGESNQPEYGPGRHGPYPEGSDYQTEYGHELNLPGRGPTRLPPPGGPTSSGQVVPRGSTVPATTGDPAAAVPGEEGRQITVRPRAPLPPRTVPGTAGGPPGTPDVATPSPDERWYGPFNINRGVPGLTGLGPAALPWLVRGALGGAASVPFTATPAETGELPPYKGPSPEDYPDSTNYPTGLPQLPKQDPADPPLPPPRPKDKPATATRPRQVWVPGTPGHYVPTPGIGRGGGTWVPGTPGHYMDAPPEGPRNRTTGVNDIVRAPPAAQGAPPAAASPETPLPTRKPPEAAPGPSVAQGGPTGGGGEMMAQVLGGLLPVLLPELGMMAFAGMGGRHGRGMRLPFMRGMGRYPRMWGGGPLRPGYYPHPSGGMAFHPGGYHPGWGGRPGVAGQPTAAANWQPGTWSPGSGRAPPRNVKNLNPGNIIDGPWARSQPGYAGSDGHFARFATGADGMRAMQANLQNYGRRGLNTIRGIVGRWAPAGSGEGNRPDIYAAAVARMAGMRPDEPIDFTNPEVMMRIAEAMAAFEGGISPQNVRAAFGGGGQPATASAGGGGLRGRLSITDPNPALGETSGAPPYAGSDQPADINANVG